MKYQTQTKKTIIAIITHWQCASMPKTPLTLFNLVIIIQTLKPLTDFHPSIKHAIVYLFKTSLQHLLGGHKCSRSLI